MIKQLSFLLILLLSIPCTVTSQVWVGKFSKDWDANGNDGNGGVSNAMKEFYPDSFKDQMSQYDYCIILFNNRRGTINKHINGQKDGLWINIEEFDLFYLSEENYKDGKLDGNCNYYYKDGQLAKEENYTNGVLDGSYKYYYYRIGKLRFIKNYKEGKQDGQYKRWYEDGRLMYETEFINGTGIDKLYNENGKLAS
jgi:antitoxin component YwqK of YwqJK toxin-antitoxin module